jgi:hypothetical protein
MVTVDEVPALPWMAAAMGLLERVAATQAGAIEQASQWCAEAIAAGGLVHLFGTGHSRIPVEEMFPRYGSYPGFNPLVELSMTFHTQVVGANGQRQAMFIERTPGLAEVIPRHRPLYPARRRALPDRRPGHTGRAWLDDQCGRDREFHQGAHRPVARRARGDATGPDPGIGRRRRSLAGTV